MYRFVGFEKIGLVVLLGGIVLSGLQFGRESQSRDSDLPRIVCYPTAYFTPRLLDEFTIIKGGNIDKLFSDEGIYKPSGSD